MYVCENYIYLAWGVKVYCVFFSFQLACITFIRVNVLASNNDFLRIFLNHSSTGESVDCNIQILINSLCVMFNHKYVYLWRISLVV